MANLYTCDKHCSVQAASTAWLKKPLFFQMARLPRYLNSTCWRFQAEIAVNHRLTTESPAYQ